MTKEEAIRYLYNSGMSDEQVNAVVKALEQEPCDDAISRDEVMSLFKTYWRCFVNHENMELFKGVIQELPSVTQKPETVTEFADRCRECGDKYGKMLKQKKGRWIKWYEQKVRYRCVENIPHCKCSACDKEYDLHASQFIKYCPNCGAKMAESEGIHERESNGFGSTER